MMQYMGPYAPSGLGLLGLYTPSLEMPRCIPGGYADGTRFHRNPTNSECRML